MLFNLLFLLNAIFPSLKVDLMICYARDLVEEKRREYLSSF